MMRICVTWDLLLVLLNPPQDFTSCRAGARPGHPISGYMQCRKPQCYSITPSATTSSLSGTVTPIRVRICDRQRSVASVPQCMVRPCVQDGLPRSTNVRAASMYQASEVEQFAPGHHGYPRASEAD